VAGEAGPATIQYEEVLLDGVTVLVVDDECESLEPVKRVLQERWAQVFTAPVEVVQLISVVATLAGRPVIVGSPTERARDTL
jgi:hypothetical protein